MPRTDHYDEPVPCKDRLQEGAGNMTIDVERLKSIVVRYKSDPESVYKHVVRQQPRTTESVPIDSTGRHGRRGGNTQRQLRQRFQRVAFGDRTGMHHGAATDIRGRSASFLLEAQATDTGHLRERGASAGIRSVSRSLLVHLRRRAFDSRDYHARSTRDQRAGTGGGEHLIFSSSYDLTAVQYGHRPRIQRVIRRSKAVRQMVRISGNARGHRRPKRANRLRFVERPRSLVRALFDVGVGKISLDENWGEAVARAREDVEKVARKRHRDVEQECKDENEHLKIQHHLVTFGRALGYRVHVAANDRNKRFAGDSFTALAMSSLPSLGLPEDVAQTVGLIDVLWLAPTQDHIVCAFEVEKSTSTYSGMLRLLDLASSIDDKEMQLFLVAPDAREKEVLAQLCRPAFQQTSRDFRYILFRDLCEHCQGLCKFGDDHRVMLKIAKCKPA